MFPRLSSVRASVCTIAIIFATPGWLAPARAAAQDAPVRAVLVTGASSGIGLRMTEVLSRNGFFVYAGARTPADLARLDALPNVRAVRLDVTVQPEIDAAVAAIEAEGRGLYGLINNAGVVVMGPMIELRDMDMDFQLDVNLLGPFRVTKAFADLLIASRGRVLNTSSIAGVLTGPFSGAYSISKHGVEAFTDALAAELERFGVAVAAVEPGNYKSQIVASMVRRMRETGYSADGSRYGSMYDAIQGPLDRSQYDEPDAVARAALAFLTSETPKRRYMVVPDQAEAALTIRRALRELVELNQDQPYAYDRDALIGMLDEALGGARPDMGLHEAVVRGALAVVEEHIAAGTDLNAGEPSGNSSPLIVAAMFGRTEAARLLIDAGADVDRRNDDGSTALLVAALLCRTEIVEALLAAGADKALANNAGSTPLTVVTMPFEALRGVYDYLGATLGPYGLVLDYDRLRETRPRVAAMLR